ncbi:hypothetical protein EG328_011542 [Venturia inaequalis]|uniref:DUF1763-domain-containing protein n=1 Tax=Venturia inaequalis TaxID=5025 RepID=A0A8H3UHZ7_VENIN|nr:hypothetical protein EG327_010496 [Venturia inaequalis]KAE9981603.1 hypothetical protein EG328_011542 [Venturia inaequalis]RDI78281.1 hypothetical protein Vi05172_g11787 [Venturia inaequalis]
MHRTLPKLTSLASTLQKLNTTPSSTLSQTLSKLSTSTSTTTTATTIPSQTHLEILHAYRHLLRTSLHAVQYATPARHVILSRLRLSFRSSTLSSFEPIRIANTLQFLRNAGETTGIEHKVLKNLLHVWYWEPAQWKARTKLRGAGREGQRLVLEGAYGGFYWGLRMLNESMGLCIR